MSNQTRPPEIEIKNIISSLRLSIDKISVRGVQNHSALRKLAMDVEGVRYLSNRLLPRNFISRRHNAGRDIEIYEELMQALVNLSKDALFQEALAGAPFRPYPTIGTGRDNSRATSLIGASNGEALVYAIEILDLVLHVQPELFDAFESDPKKIKALVPPQKIAPAQFTIINGRLSVSNIAGQFSPTDSENISSAREALLSSGSRIIEN